jgi:hypothetical protein
VKQAVDIVARTVSGYDEPKGHCCVIKQCPVVVGSGIPVFGEPFHPISFTGRDMLRVASGAAVTYVLRPGGGR